MTCTICHGPDDGVPVCDNCEAIAEHQQALEERGIRIPERDRSNFSLITATMGDGDPLDYVHGFVDGTPDLSDEGF